MENQDAVNISQSTSSGSAATTPAVAVPTFFEVQLTDFDGPIDLLLHLVKSNELEIERISLAAITEQYLRCIEEMQGFDLDIASEYLVVAATLLSIKAAVLLKDPLELENETEENLPDPHRELLEKLRAAQIYKEGAQMLSGRGMLGFEVFNRPSSLSDFEDPEEVYKKHDAMLLGQAFQKLIARLGKENFRFKIEVDSITVVERMVKILDLLRVSAEPISFSKLIPDLTSRMALVNSFVAILELCRRNAIRILQDVSFQEIKIALGQNDVDRSNLSSEFDNSAAANQNVTVNG